MLTLFLLPALNLRLRPRILDLPPGTRVATNTFDLADWGADEKFEVSPPECTAHCWALFWVVPAKVAGVWRTGDGELRLEQSFQVISGELMAGGVISAITGRLRGDRIVFTNGSANFRGQVRGDTIEASDGTWRAVRIRPSPAHGRAT